MGDFIKGIFIMVTACGVLLEGVLLILLINQKIYRSGPIWMAISMIVILVVGILWYRKNSRGDDEIYSHKKNLEKEYQSKRNQLETQYKSERNQLKAEYQSKHNQLETERNQLKADRDELVKQQEILQQTIQSSLPFRNSASLVADMDLAIYGEAIDYLKFKAHPAYSSAEIVRELKSRTKEYLLELKTLQYKFEFLTSIYPELAQYIEDENELLELGEANLDLDDVKKSYDRVRNYVEGDEYQKLSTTERNQLAFDRWLSNVPSHWIGRIYEMYVAQEIKRHRTYKPYYKVDMYGIRAGVKDLGRDLIYYSESATYIIQCKCWAMSKEIHEKTMCQTLGTTVEFQVEKEIEYEQTYSLFDCFQSPPPKAIPIVVTPTPLSDVAQRFAKHLKIKVITTKKPIDEIKRSVPLIKCNINNGQKIYHLPFDQQYHRTVIDATKGEFYAMTVKEAEDKGFRRALKHYYTK